MIYLGLLMFFILEYVRPTSYVPALLALHLNSVVPGGNFIGTLLMRGRIASQYIFAERNSWIIVVLLLLLVGSFVTADVTLYAYTALTTISGYGAAYWVMMSELNTVRRVKGLFKILIAVHLFVAALNPVLFTNPATRQYVASGFFLGDGNDFALSLNIAIPLCLGLLLDSRKWYYKIIWLIGMVVLVACVILTQSRGGTIAIGCMALYYWVKSNKKIQTAAIAACFLLLIFAYAPATYFERMNMIADTEESSAQARITAWKTGVAMAIDHPLFGVGAGHFGVKYGAQYRPQDAPGPWMTAHSIYFLVLGELGFPGLILILYFFYWNLTANRQLAREVKDSPGDQRERDTNLILLSSTSASLIAFAAGAAFLSCLYYPHVYVLAGMLGATRQVVRQRMQTEAATVVVKATKPEITYHWAMRKPLPNGAAMRRLP